MPFNIPSSCILPYEFSALRDSTSARTLLTWLIKYRIFVRMWVHLRALTGVSLNIRVSCSTDVFSRFVKGLLPPGKTNPWKSTQKHHSSTISEEVLSSSTKALTFLLFFFVSLERAHFQRVSPTNFAVQRPPRLWGTVRDTSCTEQGPESCAKFHWHRQKSPVENFHHVTTIDVSLASE